MQSERLLSPADWNARCRRATVGSCAELPLTPEQQLAYNRHPQKGGLPELPPGRRLLECQIGYFRQRWRHGLAIPEPSPYSPGASTSQLGSLAQVLPKFQSPDIVLRPILSTKKRLVAASGCEEFSHPAQVQNWWLKNFAHRAQVS